MADPVLQFLEKLSLEERSCQIFAIEEEGKKERKSSTITNDHLLFVMGALILQRVQKCEVR